MRVERDRFSNNVYVWLRDTTPEPEPEPRPDWVITEADMNALVIEWLRGPMGPPGATGAHG